MSGDHGNGSDESDEVTEEARMFHGVKKKGEVGTTKGRARRPKVLNESGALG
jgi:hypothetical protein